VIADFFATKRPWSRYKDAILRYYLEPYIPKVAKLRKPILVVDGFAGRGQFGDGEPGSPLIICNTVQSWRARGKHISVELIEADAITLAQLEQVTKSYREFTVVKQGRFEVCVSELAARAKSVSMFLYLDPYTVKSLNYSRMKAVYNQISDGASVEVLMNFNVATFMRWALAALKRGDAVPPEAYEDEADYQADDPKERLEIATLNAIAGGDYWIGIANSEAPFATKLDLFTKDYCERLRESFQHVCSYPVKEKYQHRVPKYMLIYATRSPDGLSLMNDSMCKARRDFLTAEFNSDTLFDLTPPTEQLDSAAIRRDVLEVLERKGRMSRGNLAFEVLSTSFCRCLEGEIKQEIGQLLKSAKIFSSTGKVRINDDVTLSVTPFQGQ
jgi:three-Cys-motif partner protein